MEQPRGAGDGDDEEKEVGRLHLADVGRTGQ